MKLLTCRSLLPSLLCLTGLVCAGAVALLGLDSPAQCEPSFPYRDGWLGGDAAYSIPLPDGRSLWLFGDSGVANDPSETLRKRGETLVRNSIGLSTCDSQGVWSIRYYWGNQYKPGPKAFFDSRSEKYWYWPGDGFTYNGSVYVALMKLRGKPEQEAFPFEYIGAHLARITNLSAPPAEWEITYVDLFDGLKVLPGVTIVREGDYAYLFTLFERDVHPPSPLILTRVRLDKLSQPVTHLEYWAKDKTWKAGLDPADAFPVMEQGQSEMTVRYHADLGKWVAVSLEPKFLSNRIMVRSASTLTGPWSGWQTVYEIPEMLPTTPGYDKDTWCYAVKEHIQFARDNRLLVTYACNSFQFEKMLSNMNIYRPQPVWIQLPKSLE